MGKIVFIYENGKPIKLVLNDVEIEGLAVDELRKLKSKIKSREQVKRKRVKPHTPARRYNPLDWSFSFESLQEREFERELELYLGITESDKARHYKRIAAREAKREASAKEREASERIRGTKQEQEQVSSGLSFNDLMTQLDRLI